VLEDVGNLFSVFFVSFLSTNRFDILRVGEDDIAGGFQNVVDGNSVLSCGFHTHIFAVVFSQPSHTPPQVSGERRKPLAFVTGNALLIR